MLRVKYYHKIKMRSNVSLKGLETWCMTVNKSDF